MLAAIGREMRRQRLRLAGCGKQALLTSGQTGLALFPKIKQVQAVEFNGAG